jgi:hypothetical protein
MTIEELKAISAIKARDFCVKSDDRVFLKTVLDNDPRKAVQEGVMSRLRKLATSAPAEVAPTATVEVAVNAPPTSSEDEAEKIEKSDTATCPHCNKIADTPDEVEKFFGYRTLPSKKHGSIQVRQSRCKKCRGAKTCVGPKATARRAAAASTTATTDDPAAEGAGSEA